MSSRGSGDFEPVLVRIAGLPAAALKPFASALCARNLAECDRCFQDLVQARAAAADRLHAAIPEAPADLRRFLLARRRDCFNGRDLRGWQRDERWGALRDLVGGFCDSVVDCEQRLAEARRSLAGAYERQRERERSHLSALLADRRLRRGIALASPISLANAHRLNRVPAHTYGRKDLRLESTLLRYVSRAAFKLSPFSTFTPLTLGAVRDEAEVRLPADGGAERSLLRLKRYLLDQCWDLLQACPAVRDGLQVALNNSIEEVSPGRYRFMRPGHWALDAERGAFCYVLPAIVTAAVGRPLTTWLLHELPARLHTRPGLLAAADAELPAGSPADNLRQVEQLLKIGFLRLLPPWPIHEAHLERRMAIFLRTLAEDPGPGLVAAVLDRIVALELGFPAAESPEQTAVELEGLLDELWAAAAAAGGIDPATSRSRLRTGNFYEDVFLEAPPGEMPRGESVQIPRAAVQRTLSSVEPLLRVLGLFSLHHEFLHTLEAFMIERWPDRLEVGALELFGAIQSLWVDYVKYLRALRGAARETARFNPFRLEQIEELMRLRRMSRQRLAALVVPSAEESQIEVSRLAALSRDLPECYAPLVGACLFLQPADAGGHLWVLNRLFEGTARYSSRFTAVMSEETRSRYTAHLADRAVDAHGVEFLDLMCPQGDTLNVHAPQTRYVLEMPGDSVALPTARRVSLRDLRIRRGAPGERLRVVDAGGRPYLPVHLGGAGFDFLPTPLKMLSLFGPGEVSFSGLPRQEGHAGDMTFWNRLTLGNVVLLRKRWYIAGHQLAGAVETASDPEAFAAINRWRLEREIPDRVVFIEKIHHESGEERYKPQYLDFTSPSFVAMFRGSLRENAASLTFEEMLPVPDAAPRDLQGQGRAIELMLDTLALEPRSLALASPTAGVASPVAVHPVARGFVRTESHAGKRLTP